MKIIESAGLALALALALAGCQRGVDARRIEAAKPGEWLTYGRTYDEQRFSPLKQIDRASVGKLGVAWWAEFDTDRGQEATPLIADGVLYTTTAWSKVHAFDAKTGKQLWAFDPKVDGAKGFDACCDVVNRGVALWGGKVYVGALDGRLIALDARTGKTVWSTQTTDPKLPYTITGAPRAIKGKILIGNGGAEYPVRGFVSAYDARTGKLAWRFHMTPNPTGAPDGAASDKIMKEKVAATWSDGAWKDGGGGATPWDAISYDPKTDLVFVGTGNAGPWNDKVRSGGKGDNLFATSVVALKPETGEYAWHYQTTVRDAWDYDAVQQIMTADLPIGGRTRHVAMQANKNGFFYVLDAASGKLLSAEKFVPVDWAEKIDLVTGRPVEAPFARYQPGKESHQVSGALGGHNWQPMAFNPKLGLVFIPAMTSPGGFGDPDHFKFTAGAWNTAMQRGAIGPHAPKPQAPPAGARRAVGELVAWDPVAQKARWRVPASQFWTSGVLATDGGLVFHSAGHDFSAYDAATGKVLWTYDTLADPIAAASTYEIDGEQYVALMVGYGGAGGMGGTEPRRKGRLLVFKLGGAVHPAAYPTPVVLPPLDLAAAEPSKGDADHGGALVGQFCGQCHGRGAFLPDLTHSPAILSRDGFKAIVLDGAKRQNGMAPFRRFLADADAEDIRAFWLWAARSMPATPPKGGPQPPPDHPH
ncbi:PQQ-dependent dehydrogenase, methanol/ethanol family [Phenylobacterium sp.]|uniref:PQQ-dependent dehydrogenase, methanol/ethanol family n=1 Tax=Phenylobacterium sp. TaxID=1871053 RepID=UPI002E351EE7|nr:PQQ-dependent dehydrogenase, methanol/ethanol family [Phenylobacterium sp.]HEX4712624.1 PQQ-dependent dehydrogenase, methanol/ethanol family [Phenylobacterium sp.]